MACNSGETAKDVANEDERREASAAVSVPRVGTVDRDKLKIQKHKIATDNTGQCQQ